jgi:hypothetical protein
MNDPVPIHVLRVAFCLQSEEGLCLSDNPPKKAEAEVFWSRDAGQKRYLYVTYVDDP